MHWSVDMLLSDLPLSGEGEMLGVFLDTETNGLNPLVHKILEIAFKVVDLRTGEIKGQYQSLIAQPADVWGKSDPASLRINGFTWDEVKIGRTPRHAAQQIVDLFQERNIRRKAAVFICQNPSFDRVFFSQVIDPDTQELLNWPYHWLDLASMFWAISMEKIRRNHEPLPWELQLSKDAIAAYYHLPLEEKPHRAMNGVNHLLLCYQAIVGFPAPVA
jgi:oligoribonuclease